MLPLRRMHLLELEDQPWFPAPLRDWALDHLGVLEHLVGAHDPIVPLVAELLEETGCQRIVDLCSGSGSAPAALRAGLTARGVDCEVVLTDLYPNLRAFQALEAQGLRHVPEPVDAARVPDDLTGLRTLFNAFHHMPEDVARSILADAAHKGQPILIVETVRRSASAMALVGGAAAGTFLLAPFTRPFSAGRLAFTYLLPAVPFTVFFDGIVSCLRVYSPDELRALTTGLDPGYRFEVREVGLPSLPWSLLVCVGRVDRADPGAG